MTYLKRKDRIEEGSYKVMILGVEEYTSMNGKKLLKLQFITNEEGNGHNIEFESMIPMESNHPYPLLDQLLDSICEECEKGLNTYSMVDRCCVVDVEINNQFINIKQFKKLDDEEWVN